MQRNTKQRQVILEELQKLKTHPTPAELYGLVRRRLPRISLGTIYRNLEQLAQHQVITKLELGANGSRFDADLHQHYHVRCTACGQIDDLPQSSVQLGRQKVAKKSPNGYEITGQHLEFIGLCPACRKQKRPGP